MRGQTNSKTMTIRLPVEVCEALTKIRDSNNLATVGSALKYWIEQQTNEKIESRLNVIEEQINKLTKIAKGHTELIVGLDNLMNRILNLFLKANQRFEALEKVK